LNVEIVLTLFNKLNVNEVNESPMISTGKQSDIYLQ